MSNLNPIYFIEGNLEAAIAGSAVLASAGIPQRFISNAVNRFRNRRQLQQQPQYSQEEPMSESIDSDETTDESNENISPYIKMMRKNRRIINQNAFPYEQ